MNEKFLISRKFEFGFIQSEHVLTKEWQFIKGGAIAGYTNVNEKFWKIINHDLRIFSKLVH